MTGTSAAATPRACGLLGLVLGHSPPLVAVIGSWVLAKLVYVGGSDVGLAGVSWLGWCE
jgi:hypothetical protein